MTGISIYDLTDEMLPTRKPASNGGYGIGRPKFTREHIRSILAAYEAGDTLASIARSFNCTPEAVRYQLRRHGIEGRRTLGKGAKDASPVRSCSRCGIRTDAPEMCQDCVDVLALDVAPR